jgi:hypothetical protein
MRTHAAIVALRAKLAQTRARTMAGPLIADRGEFIDALKHLQRGAVLVRAAQDDERCAVNGCLYYTVWPPLAHYGLLDEVPSHDPDVRVRCYRLNDRGHAFAERAVAQWRRTPWLRRMLVRVAG